MNDPTTNPQSPLAAKVREARALFTDKNEARAAARREHDRISEEVPRRRKQMTETAEQVRSAKVAQLLGRGTPVDIAATRKSHDDAAELLEDSEDRLQLLSEVQAELERDVVAAREELKQAETALLREVLRKRAENSTPLLRTIALEIALENELSGSVGIAAMLNQIQVRLENGDGVLKGQAAFREQLLRAEGAL
jgi:hypothetical protein